MKLIDVTREFATEEKCLSYLEAMRWPNGVCCIACGSQKVSKFVTEESSRERYSKRKKQVVTVKVPARHLYQCLEKECAHQFSAAAGTIFHDSHLPLKTWFMAIAIICEAKKSVSACQMQHHLGLGSYRTAWHLCHRIRAAMKEHTILSGPAVEVDETYIYPRVPRKAMRGKIKDKKIVLGMVERGTGKVHLTPNEDTKSRTMRPHFAEHISEQVGTIYSDEHPIYIMALKPKFEGKHLTINHKKTYGIGSTHTNTIENAFSLFKKALYGSFHHVSRKHLSRYCDEFSFRFSRRKAQEDLFADTNKKLVNGKALTYEALTSEISES